MVQVSWIGTCPWKMWMTNNQKRPALLSLHPRHFPFLGGKFLFSKQENPIWNTFLLYNTFPSTPQKLLHSLHSAAVLFPSNNALLSFGISHPCFVTSWNYSVTETSNRETKHHIWRVGELRFITPAGPEELTFQALSPNKGVTEFLQADYSGQHQLL